MEKNYFSELGYIANVPLSVVVAVIETAIEGGYEYPPSGHYVRFHLVDITMNDAGDRITIVYADSVMNRTDSITFDGRRHTISGRLPYFSTVEADYICWQILRLYRLHDNIFGQDTSANKLREFFPFRVSEKILRSVILTMDSSIMRHYPAATHLITVKELDKDFIMFTSTSTNSRKVLYNKRTTQVEFPEGTVIVPMVVLICDYIKNHK